MSAILEEFVRVGVYKRSQGRIVRQVTFAALALTLIIGLWKLYFMLRGTGDSVSPWLSYGVPAVLGVVGLWVVYRAVNWPLFADFLIAVEVEMNKVSWPSRSEMWRSTLVVIVLIFAIGLLLACFDALWVTIFGWLGVYKA